MSFLAARNLLQPPGAVVMIRPHAFTPNPETAGDKAFQKTPNAASAAGRIAYTVRSNRAGSVPGAAK